MTADQRKTLVLALPADAPYFEIALGARGGETASSVERRLSLALFDPALGWNLAQSYARRGLPLPELPWPAEVLRAHAFSSQTEPTDLNMVLVEALHQPETQRLRDVVRALLLCQDASLERIAQLLGVDIEVISLFELLFWDVSYRRNDPLYLVRIINPQGLAGEAAREQEQDNPGLKLLRLACAGKHMDAVLAVAGLSVSALTSKTEQEWLDQIEQQLVSEAHAELQRNELDGPALELMERFLLDLRPTDPGQARAAVDLAMAEAVAREFKEYGEEQIRKLDEADRKYRSRQSEQSPPQ